MKTQDKKTPQRDKTRDKWGVKAKRRQARRNKDKRRAYECRGWK